MPSEVKLESTTSPIRLVLSEDLSSTGSQTGKPDAYFVWNGNAQQASAVWSIHHNLNKYCSVTVVDDDNNIVVADVLYIDKNNLEIHFAAAVTGRAYLN